MVFILEQDPQFTEAGSHFNIKMSNQYNDSHNYDKLVIKPSYVYNGIMMTWKRFLYRNKAQGIMKHDFELDGLCTLTHQGKH